jgi:hypothetical protein
MAKLTGKAIIWATIRLQKHENVKTGETVGAGQFKQPLFKETVSFTWTSYVNADQGLLPLPSILRSKNLLVKS